LTAWAWTAAVRSREDKEGNREGCCEKRKMNDEGELPALSPIEPLALAASLAAKRSSPSIATTIGGLGGGMHTDT